MVYLTFDAGYENGNVARVLDALAQADAAGAFFVLGNLARQNPDLLRRMAAEGKAVAVVLHDLCLAMRTAHRIAVLADGRLQALDRPEAVYASGILPRIFGVSLSRTETEQGWQYYYDYELRPAGQELAEGGVL